MADNVTTEELEIALQELAEGMGLSVKEYVEGGFLDLTTYGADKAAIVARLDALDIIDGSDGVDTLAEKVATLNDLLSENGDLATDILNRIAANSAATKAVQTELTQAKTDIAAEQAIQDTNIERVSSNIASLTQTVADRAAESEAADALTDSRLSAIDSALSLIGGDDTVVGSTDYKVEQERLRAVTAENFNRSTSDANIATAKQEAIDAAGLVTIAGDEALQSQIDALGNTSDSANTVITALQSELDASQAAIGLETDGTFVGEDESDTLYEYIADVAGDANSLKKQVRKLARRSKQADSALADDIETINNTIAAGNAAANILTADLAAEVATRADETAANTAANVATENKVVQEIADRTAADTSLQNQIDKLSGTGTGSLGDVELRVASVENIVNDTVDSNGDLVKGNTTKIADNAAAIAAETAARVAAMTQTITDLQAYSDARDLKASSMDMCSIGNKFRNALGLSDATCGDNTAGSGL